MAPDLGTRGWDQQALLLRCFACARQRWQPAASRATFQRVSERVVRTGQVHAAWPPAIGWSCIPDTHAHTPTYTPTHTPTHTHTHAHIHTHTHTQRHIHYMPHYSPDLPINASLRGPPCSGVYIYIYIYGPYSGLCSLCRRLMIPIRSSVTMSSASSRSFPGVGGRGVSP